MQRAPHSAFPQMNQKWKKEKKKKATQFSKIPGSAREFVGVREMQRTNKSAVQI